MFFFSKSHRLWNILFLILNPGTNQSVMMKLQFLQLLLVWFMWLTRDMYFWSLSQDVGRWIIVPRSFDIRISSPYHRRDDNTLTRCGVITTVIRRNLCDGEILRVVIFISLPPLPLNHWENLICCMTFLGGGREGCLSHLPFYPLCRKLSGVEGATEQPRAAPINHAVETFSINKLI